MSFMQKLKPVAAVSLAALMVLGVVPAASAAQVTFTDPTNGISYRVDDTNVAAGATVIGGLASTDLSIPATVTIGGTEYDVTSIGDFAYQYVPVTSVIIPDSVTSIGQFAFANDNSLTSVTIPDSVTSIGTAAFLNNLLTSVHIPNSITSIPWAAFAGNRLTSVTIPASLTSLGTSAFGGGNYLTSVRFLGAIPTMGRDVFYNWSGPVTVLYPLRYGASAVAGGYPTPTWTPAGTTDVYNTQPFAQVAYDTTGGSATAPVNVTVGDTTAQPADPTWAGHAFTGWFTAATGGSAWDFTSRVTADTTLYAQWRELVGPVTLTDSEGFSYLADDGNVAAGASITDYAGTSTTLSIPSIVTIRGVDYNVTGINGGAFDGTPVQSVTIPNTMTSIGSAAFQGSNLTSVTIPNSVTSIGDHAFYSTPHLTSVTIPNSVTSIGEGAFYFSSLTSVTIPNSVTSIGEAAFAYNNLTSVVIPSSVTSIGGFAFDSNSLTSVTIPNSITSVGEGTFQNNSLTSVTIPNSITSIGEYAFAFNKLTSVSIPSGITSIGSGAFSSNALTSVTIPDSVTGIGGTAFAFNKLASVSIPSGVTSIGEYTFAFNKLASVSIPDSITTIGDHAFDSNMLESVAIPDSVTTIGDHAFYNSGLVGSLTMPGSVTSIGNFAFDETDIWSVHFLGAVPTTVGSTAFGTFPGLVVSYLPQYSSSAVSGGFTFPTWTPAGTTDVYATYAIANVSFDTTGGSTAPAPVGVNADGTAPRPADPTWAGHVFTGWFTAASGGSAWDFTSRVGADTTLYAQWAAVTPPVLIPPLVDETADTLPAVALNVNLAVGSPIGNAPVTVSGTGLLANSPWSVVLHSTPTTVASGTVSSTGTFSDAFSLPASIPAGAHTLTLTGTAPDGTAVTKVVYVTVSSEGTLDYLSARGPQSDLAATGVNTPTDGLVGGALLMLLLGSALLYVGRRRRATR